MSATSRTLDYIAGALIVIALAFLFAVAGSLLGLDLHRALLPLGLILFLAVALPMLLTGLAIVLSRQAVLTRDRANPQLMFARLKRASRIAGVVVAAFYLVQFIWIILAGTSNTGSKLLYSKVAGKPEKIVSVLFIGNSFTYVEDMPGKLITIASSDATNKVQLVVYSVTRGGADLAYMFQNPQARDALKLRHWDYLVLQEQSQWTGSQDRIEETYSSVSNWSQAARQLGIVPLLYETWADKAGSPFYTEKDSYFYRQTPDKVQENIDSQSTALAQQFSMAVVPVGKYWAYAEKQPNAPDLYAPDRHHPSLAGAYLTALMFYQTFTGMKADNVRYRPTELTPEQAQFLIEIASK